MPRFYEWHGKLLFPARIKIQNKTSRRFTGLKERSLSSLDAYFIQEMDRRFPCMNSSTKGTIWLLGTMSGIEEDFSPGCASNPNYYFITLLRSFNSARTLHLLALVYILSFSMHANIGT
jgi:hypothetical protein